MFNERQIQLGSIHLRMALRSTACTSDHIRSVLERPYRATSIEHMFGLHDLK